MERVVVHDRVGVRGQHVPVEEDSFVSIPEEYYEDLEKIKAYVTELENSRYELGRLMQVVNHLVYVCNTAERNLANAKQGIISGMGLGDGNWVIDFENKQLGKAEPIQKPMPSVV